MAFNKLIPNWVTGFTSDGTNWTVPIATTPELVASEVDATTGDFRRWLFAFMEYLYTKWAATAAADRPTKLTLQRVQNIDQSTGIITKTYTITVQVGTTGQEVVAEP